MRQFFPEFRWLENACNVRWDIALFGEKTVENEESEKWEAIEKENEIKAQDLFNKYCVEIKECHNIDDLINWYSEATKDKSFLWEKLYKILAEMKDELKKTFTIEEKPLSQEAKELFSN